MKLRVILLLVLALAGGAIAVDRVSPAEPAARSTVSLEPAAGVLSCPYVTEPGGSAYIQVANVGSSAASVRLGIGASKGSPIAIGMNLPAGSTKSLRVPGTAAGRAAAVIEYSGGPIVATHMLFLSPSSGPVVRAGGAAASPCARAGGQDIVVTGARTLGTDVGLALFNPGSADADVSISLIADGRVLQPQRLTRRIVPSHARRDFRLGDFAFSARNVTAVVHATSGRIVAEGLLRSTQGVEFLPGQAPSDEMIAVAGQSGSGTGVGLTVIGQDDAGIEARLINAVAQTSVPGFPPSLPPAGGRYLVIPDQGNGAAAAYAFRVTVGSPIVAGTSWITSRGTAQEQAVLPGAVPSTQWGAVLAAFQPASVTRAVIVNPGGVPSLVHVTTFGPSGVSAQDVSIPAGRLIELPIGKGTGIFAVFVAADGPVVLALRNSTFAAGSQASSVAVAGESFVAATPEAVAIDPRAGMPAVLPTR
jgi:hypothetical protein